MAIWIVRAGKHGEYENKFLSEGRVYATWENLMINVAELPSRDVLSTKFQELYPDSSVKTLRAWVSQVWPFAMEMKPGDFVVTPSKMQPAIYVGEIAGDYHFAPEGPSPYYHWRSVKWVADPVPREHFGIDLLHSFGSALTICRVQRNNAEVRLEKMKGNGWSKEFLATSVSISASVPDDSNDSIELEELAQDQIAQRIAAQFKGHELTRLVDGILKAQGYTTYLSPAGADGGADILAGAGPLGFGEPRLCVEVKSEATPIDRPTVDKLIGAVTKFGAHEGLFVSWSGFKPNVQKELAASFFRVRLWSRRELLEALFAHYDQLDADIKAELPLKRIWTVAAQDEGQ